MDWDIVWGVVEKELTPLKLSVQQIAAAEEHV
ncbi:MAG: hypothetical protein JXX14_17330 [Deltaproteobacteria bacterium]|nr:hypothetical protein [Deltaproteobacteria bacterium]